MELNKDDITDFLEKIRIEIASYNKAKQKYHDRLSPEFSLFSLFKQNEMSISRCISFLLNPGESHAQSHLFLHDFYSKFLSSYRKPDEILCQLEKSIDIVKNDDIGLRRLDVYIETDELLIGIENKPWATDSKDQLNNYAEWLSQQANKKGKHWKLIYLSPSEYSEDSLSAENKKKYADNISHLTFYEIKKWLDDTTPFVKSPHVKVFTESFSDYINRSINIEPSMELSSDLIELVIKKRKNLNAAIVIAKNLPSIKAAIMNNFIDHLIDNIPPDIHIGFEEDTFKAEKSYCGFNVLFLNSHKYHLTFSFDSTRLRDFFWGFERRDETPAKNKSKNHIEIIKSMNEIFPEYVKYAEKRYDNYPWWCQSENTLNFPNNWNEDDSIWEKLQNTGPGSFVDKIINIINKINKNFDLELLK